MKKIIISLAALAAVSTAAFAERNYDLRDPGAHVVDFGSASTSGNIELLAQPAGSSKQVVYYGEFGQTTNAMEARRWDEKNGN